MKLVVPTHSASEWQSQTPHFLALHLKTLSAASELLAEACALAVCLGGF